ncbi:MAG: ATP-grasp domain-containing protein [Butyrivibrio sp.]|nr:ATP-grasp domain-containing protein [Butyrivibrio sp.]
MIKTDLRGKKLLLVGGLNTTADLTHLAKRNGVLLGVADYNHGTLLKGLSDFAYDTDAYDEEAMVSLCRKEHIDGVITAFNERLGPVVRRLADRMGYYAPFSVEQLKMSTDKSFFKHTCMKYGVPVPKEYNVTDENDTESSDIDFPVIVKPVDNASSVGVTPCYDVKSLKEAYKRAISNSRSGNVIVEKYLPYDEINMTYIAQDGDIQLAAVHDRYFNREQDSYVNAPDLYIYPSRYTDLILEKYDAAIRNMLEKIGVKNGSLFIQAVVNGDKMYCYEAGMRLNGCKTYQILERENGYNTFEHLMEYALTGSMGEHCRFDPRFSKWYATINVLGKPGADIARYCGEEELNSYPWLIHIAKRYREGDSIPAGCEGTLIQDTTRIHVEANAKDELMERIDKVNELYKILDKDNKNIILKPHDTKEVLRGLDYELGV